jgi:hypothetical protein
MLNETTRCWPFKANCGLLSLQLEHILGMNISRIGRQHAQVGRMNEDLAARPVDIRAKDSPLRHRPGRRHTHSERYMTFTCANRRLPT